MTPRTDHGVLSQMSEVEAAVRRLREAIERTAIDASDAEGRLAPEHAAFAEAIVAGRVRLAEQLSCPYLGDPALDMLLDLYVAAQRGQTRTFKACAVASGAPQATASRYVDLLVRDNLASREPDPADGRRTIIRLNEDAVAVLDVWLGSIVPNALRRSRAG